MPAVGPALRRVAHELPLAVPTTPKRREQLAGGATAADGSLRVVLRAHLLAIDPGARSVRWSRDLSDLLLEEGGEDPGGHVPAGSEVADPAPPRLPVSLPTILAEDRTLVTVGGTAVILDARGELRDRVVVPMVDDSGPPPNTDLEGRPILTTIVGDVHVWHPDGLHSAGTGYGYDIVPVAVYADGTFAISGYAGKGFCRVASDGRLIWRSDLAAPDLVPTVSRAQHAAVGSLDEGSAIFAADGRRLATYATAATFAEYEVDRGWVALGSDSLARLSSTGEVRWRHRLAADGNLRWGCYRPIVDAEGTIYVATDEGIAAFDGDGARRGALALGGRPGPLVPVRAGLMAALVGDTLFLVE